MLYASRPRWRLFCLQLGCVLLALLARGTAQAPTLTTVADPSAAVVVSGGKLQIAGGTGVDGTTTVTFVEKLELGGSWVLEHGDVVFTSALSSGILGGLYLGIISAASCLAGFQITPAGSASQIERADLNLHSPRDSADNPVKRFPQIVRRFAADRGDAFDQRESVTISSHG